MTLGANDEYTILLGGQMEDGWRKWTRHFDSFEVKVTKDSDVLLDSIVYAKFTDEGWAGFESA